MSTAAESRRHRGLTLIELLVTLAIAAIVLSLAVPGLEHLIAKNRMTTAVNTLIANLQLTRSEAVKRGVDVMLCPTPPAADPEDPDALDCAERDNWDTGYILFADNNGDNNRETGADSSEPLIRVASKNAAVNLTIRSNHSGDQASYRGDGTGSAGTFTFCDVKGTADPRWVTISPSGRARLSTTKPTAAAFDCL